MKIIAVGMNYAQHNKELGHTQVNTEPVIFMKPDSAILKDGKPFFIPDFSKEIHYETELVVRINRLGKNIAPRFAVKCRVICRHSASPVNSNVSGAGVTLTFSESSVSRVIPGSFAKVLIRRLLLELLFRWSTIRIFRILTFIC